MIGYFNSIKVRLEQIRLAARRISSKFQFHKGTIRTFMKKETYHEDEISIP